MMNYNLRASLLIYLIQSGYSMKDAEIRAGL